MLLNIKSKYIIKELFKNIKTNIKLKIIKYNKQLLNKLDITKENFQTYLDLKEFNDKYNLKIKNIDTESLNVVHQTLGNEGFEYLSKIKFRQLKEIDFFWVGTLNINI